MALPILIEPDLQSPPPAKTKRRPFRPPVMPVRKARSRLETVISVLVHLGIIWFALQAPDYTGDVEPIAQGAGGPGPAGGGGGRSRRETITYIQPQPAPPPQPKPQLVFKTPEIKQLPTPPVEPLKLEPISAPVAATTGASADPTVGAGPGSGGGVGSGVGTGSGTSNGPGTGGGEGAYYPPQATEMFIPPLPVPASVRGFRVIAEFDVDERGKVLSMKFTETADRGYNRRLADVLKSFRFRPGTRKDGTPVRMKAQVSIDLP